MSSIYLHVPYLPTCPLFTDQSSTDRPALDLPTSPLLTDLSYTDWPVLYWLTCPVLINMSSTNDLSSTNWPVLYSLTFPLLTDLLSVHSSCCSMCYEGLSSKSSTSASTSALTPVPGSYACTPSVPWCSCLSYHWPSLEQPTALSCQRYHANPRSTLVCPTGNCVVKTDVLKVMFYSFVPIYCITLQRLEQFHGSGVSNCYTV